MDKVEFQRTFILNYFFWLCRLLSGCMFSRYQRKYNSNMGLEICLKMAFRFLGTYSLFLDIKRLFSFSTCASSRSLVQRL